MPALLLTADLTCSSKVSGAAARAQSQVATVMNPAIVGEKLAAGDVTLLLVDLTAPGLNLAELVPQWRTASPVPLVIVAFGPHVHEAKLAAAAEAGCDRVLSRGEFHARTDTLLAEAG